MAFDIRKYLEDNKIELGSYETTESHNVAKGVSDIRKTQHEVHIVDGKFQLDTLKKVIVESKQLNEGTQYPNQYAAEAMVEWMAAMNSLSLSGVDASVRDAVNKCENIRTNLHSQIFGEKSPWSMQRKGNKFVVVWDKDKAKKLGL